MIKRTPQEIADFFQCYVAMDQDGCWNLFATKPKIDGQLPFWTVETGAIVCLGNNVKSPSGHYWTHLYEPCVPSPNKNARETHEYPHQSEVYTHMEYCLLVNVDHILLTSQIEKMMADGWRPQGGIAVAHLPQGEGYGNETCFHQAMTRGV